MQELEELGREELKNIEGSLLPKCLRGMEGVTSMKKNRKNNGVSRALNILFIIALLALYLGYIDGRHDKQNKNQDIELKSPE